MDPSVFNSDSCRILRTIRLDITQTMNVNFFFLVLDFVLFMIFNFFFLS